MLTVLITRPVSVALLILAFSACAAPSQRLNQLPRLGDSRDAVRSMLAGTEKNDPATGVFYVPTFNGEKIEVNVEYVKIQSGTERVSLIELWGHGRALSDATAAKIEARVVPRAESLLAVRSLSKEAAAVLWGGTMTHSLHFFRSAVLAVAVRAPSYLPTHESRVWIRGACPFARPGDYGVLKEYDGRKLKRIVIASLYLSVCEEDPNR